MIRIPAGSKCVVVGATDPSSIGFCVALTLLRGGAGSVAIVGRDRSKLDAAVADLESRSVREEEDDDDDHRGDRGGGGDDDDPSSSAKPKRVVVVVAGVLGDLKDPGSMAGVIEEAAIAVGGGIDVLVCCGGNGYAEYLGPDATDPESYRMLYDVAVLSPMFLARAAAPHLSRSKQRGGGSVVVVGSVAASVPWPSTAPHNLATAAKNAMVETLAFEHRSSNVRVNGVRAGIVRTGALDVMARSRGIPADAYAAKRAAAQPLGRCGTPQEVADAVAYLASPASAYTTGTFVTVDGGLHLTSWWNRPAMLNSKSNGGEPGRSGNSPTPSSPPQQRAAGSGEARPSSPSR